VFALEHGYVCVLLSQPPSGLQGGYQGIKGIRADCQQATDYLRCSYFSEYFSWQEFIEDHTEISTELTPFLFLDFVQSEYFRFMTIDELAHVCY
jgi:hypothetical protein